MASRVGEAKRGRLAELPAISLSLQQQECQVLIEHYSVDHLLGWIRNAVENLR